MRARARNRSIAAPGSSRPCSAPAWALVVLAALAADIVPLAGQTAHEPHRFLRTTAGLSREELGLLERGGVVAEVLEDRAPNEVAIFGAATVECPPDFFLSSLRDIERFKSGENVLAVHRFGDPPTIQDLAALTLEPDDIRDLRECEAGDCDVKLSAAMIERFHEEMDWSAPGHEEAAQALFRRMLLEYVQRYLAEGDDALIVYHDRPEPVDAGEQLEAMLDRQPLVPGMGEELRRHIAEFPRGGIPGTIELVYWSKEKYSPLKPIVTITHLTIHRPSTPGGAVVAVSRQLYASHYLNGSIGLTAFVEESGGFGEPTRYLLHASRARPDALGGWLGIKRKLVEGKAEGAMRRHLGQIRGRLAAAWSEQGGVAAAAGE